MYPGRPCRHCTKQGCAIYDSRPEDPCRDFACGWLQNDSPLPEEMRPDKSGVIVLLDRKWEGLNVINAIPVGKSIPEASQRWLMQYAQAVNTPLILTDRIVEEGQFVGISLRGFGPPEFRLIVENAMSPEDIFKM